MRIFVATPDGEEGPMGLEELRDRLDLGMVAVSQPCRIQGTTGRYVVGELLSGHVFRDLAAHGPPPAIEGLDEPEPEPEPEDDPGRDGPDGRHAEEEDEEDGEADNGEDEDGEADSAEEDQEEFFPEEVEKPLWSRHPSMLGFPWHLAATVLLVVAAGLSWKLEWSGGLGAAFGSLACFSASLLLWRKTANHLQIYPDRLVVRSGVPWRRLRTLRRDDVESFQTCREGLRRWLGLGRIEITPRSGRPVRLVGYRRTRRAEKLWGESHP